MRSVSSSWGMRLSACTIDPASLSTSGLLLVPSSPLPHAAAIVVVRMRRQKIRRKGKEVRATLGTATEVPTLSLQTAKESAEMNITVPDEVTTRVAALTDRAASLRAQAEGLPEVLAVTY